MDKLAIELRTKALGCANDHKIQFILSLIHDNRGYNDSLFISKDGIK